MGTNFIGRSKSVQNTIALLEAARASQRPTILWGPPGVGKTALIESLALRERERLGFTDPTSREAQDAFPLEILSANADPADLLGLPAIRQITLADGSAATITDYTLNLWAQRLLSAKRGILFADELSNASPSLQAAMLTLLQSRTINGHALSPDVWILAAANPASQAADGFDLAPPTANRFIHIDYSPDSADFYEGMTVAWNAENVTGREYDERAKIVSFLKEYPSLLNAMPKSAAEQGGAWPSYRSWDAVAKMLAHLDDQSTRTLAVRGAVGEAAERQYTNYERSLKLPDYALVIDTPEKVSWKSLSTGELYVVLTMVLGRMSSENVEKSATVFATAAKVAERADVCGALAMPLVNAIAKNATSREVGVKLMGTVLREYGPYVKAAKLR